MTPKSWGGKREKAGSKAHRQGQSNITISFRIPKWMAEQLEGEALMHESIKTTARRFVFEALQTRLAEKKPRSKESWEIGDEGYVSCSSSPDGVALAKVIGVHDKEITVTSDSPYMDLKSHRMPPEYLYKTANDCREHDEKLWQAWHNSLKNNTPLGEEFKRLTKNEENSGGQSR